ncbi:unnamed protein product [Rotaria sordida]|uniref:Uncharacterized protein n=1 Tax=Rotaria sordida TaxID=392033 RepID=A0A815CG83_9BILA|nr:unnamed protein product [Rotaria sordida]CAF3900537.1 unnamed protein product [Rotaria sordida]
MRGVFLCYKEAAKIMIKQGKGGRIIGACSGAGYKLGLTQAAAIEWAPHNITVNAYCPGTSKTVMGDKYIEESAKFLGQTNEKFENDMLKMTPRDRIGHPNDVANMVSFLASKDSGYITGQSVLASGGAHFS